MDTVLDLAQVDTKSTEFDLSITCDAAVEFELAVKKEAALVTGAEKAGPSLSGILRRAEGVGDESVGVNFGAVEVACTDLCAADAELSYYTGRDGLQICVKDVVPAVGHGVSDGDVGGGFGWVGYLSDAGLHYQFGGRPGVEGCGGCLKIVKGLCQTHWQGLTGEKGGLVIGQSLQVIRSGFHEQSKLSRREVCDIDISRLHVLRKAFGILASFGIGDADSTARCESRPDLHDGEIEADGGLMQESLARVEGEIVVKSAQHLLGVGACEGDSLGFARTSLHDVRNR